ncbi:MAG: hypothetical protein L3J06_08005 [Cyclobacteriaceae bacterium]|nr:hypothetical protein [Cyclobacteriaceae bacterium]
MKFSIITFAILVSLFFTSCSMFMHDIEEVEIELKTFTTVEWIYTVNNLNKNQNNIEKLIVSKDGGILFYFNTDSDWKYFIYKVDKGGNLLWKRQFEVNYINDITTDNDNNVYVVGQNKEHYPFMIKIDSEGNTVWEKGWEELYISTVLPDSSFGWYAIEIYSVIIANDGRIVFGGVGYNPDFLVRKHEYFMASLYPDESQGLYRTNMNVSPNQLIELEDKSIILIEQNIFTKSIAAIERIDHVFGNEIWTKTYETSVEHIKLWQNNLYLLSIDNNLVKLGRLENDGSELNIYELDGIQYAGFNVSETRLYLYLPEQGTMKIFNQQMGLVKEINNQFTYVDKFSYYSNNRLIGSGNIFSELSGKYENFIAPFDFNF